MMIKYFVFDFDGTLGDSLLISLNILNDLADKYKFNPITDPETIRSKSMSEAIKELNIPYWKLLFLIFKFKSRFKREISKVKLHPGVKKTLTELKKKGYKIGLITSNSKKNIMPILEREGLTELFGFYIFNAKLFRKEKDINHAIRRYNLDRTKMVYIGDEVRDVKAAKRAKVKVGAVLWGANSEKRLAKENPDYLFKDPKEIIQKVLSR